MSPAVYSLIFAARNILRSHHERREFIYKKTTDDLKGWQQFDDDYDDDDDVMWIVSLSRMCVVNENVRQI